MEKNKNILLVMKVICDAPGQTCNRLWTYVATLSECIAQNKKMVILFFDWTIEDFPNLLNCKHIYFPLYHKWYLERGNGWNNYKGFTWKSTHSKRWNWWFKLFGFIKGWDTRGDVKYIKETKSELQKIFTPAPYITQKADNLFQEIRKQADIVVGVHIRRGDYETWCKGRFFYSIQEYYKFMLQVSDLYPDKRVAFFISSNEKINIKDYPSLNVFLYENNKNAILDLHSLSLCDMIMGPISTFSRWASFIANKPICFLNDRNMVIKKDDFSPMIDFFNFENGKNTNGW